MKKLFIILLVFVLIVIAAGFGLSIWIKEPAEALKAKVVKDAGEKIGRTITAGDFGGNPFTGFYVKDIEVYGRSEDLPKTMTLKRVKLAISLPELFKRKIVVKEISFLEPDIYLESYVDGSSSVIDITDRISLAAEKGADGKSKIESKFTVTLEKLSVRNGNVAMKVHGKDEIIKEYKVEKVNISLIPNGEGKYIINTSGDLGGVEAKGNGTVETEPSLVVALDWTSGKIDLKSPPAILAEYLLSAEKLHLSGFVETGGKFSLKDGESVIDMNSVMTDIVGVGQKFGTGNIQTIYTKDAVKLSGTIGKDGSAYIKVSGGITNGDKKIVDIEIEPSGFSVESALKTIAPEMKKILTGTTGGMVHIKGIGDDADSYVSSGVMYVNGGDIYYPSPAVKGEGSEISPVPYERIDLTFEHIKPQIKISSVKLKGNAISGTGNGTLKYTPSEDSEEEPSPVSFAFNVDVISSNVAAILESNNQLKDMVSGKFAGSGSLKGVTGNLETLAGTFSASLTDGKVLNPYEQQASKLPLNANLSHFTFKSMTGKGSVGGEKVTVTSAALRSKVLDADVNGFVTFEGAMNGHAVASVEPKILGTIENLRPVLSQFPQIESMKKIDTSFDIGGTVYAPEVKWNADDLAKRYSKKLVEQKLDKVIDKALGSDDSSGDDSLKNKLRNKLKKMF